MRRSRQTKIVATIGPASGTDDMLERLFQAGADVFRFNFSHGTHEEHAAQLKRVRALEERVNRPIGVLADLQGPKLRVGRFANAKVSLETGKSFRLDLSDEPGCVGRVQLPHSEIFAALRPGAQLLLDDGRLCLGVTACGADFADTTVVAGGTLSNNKGVNLPNCVLDVSPLTEKDRRDLAFALDIGISLIALSFVQRPEDVEEAMRLIDGRAHLISKLEKPSAIEKLDDIVDLTDGVMVARGDLGVELPPEMVPAIQKRIIRTCRQAGKPVIVATQMLESMITAPTPTRAEASDVANAVYEGADAVMLSGETAVGKYPVAAVSMMDRIIRHSESDPAYPELLNAGQAKPRRTTADTISDSASRASATLPAAAIVTFTMSGVTALRASRRRPPVPILAFSPTLWVARNLSGVWGIHAVLAEMMDDHVDMDALAVKVATDEKFAKSGDHLVITAGLPLHVLSPTNVMRLVHIQHTETERPVEVTADIRV
jgi:pyruvate kinase